MAGLRPTPSLRQLPLGKLQSLKEMFEQRDKEASGALLYGMTPRIEEEEEEEEKSASPVSNLVQRRIFSSPRAAPSSRKTWLAPDFVTSPSPVKLSRGKNNRLVLGSGRQHSSSESESPGQCILSTQLSERLALFSDSKSTAREESYTGSESRSGSENRSGSESREGSPTKLFSDSSVRRDDAGILRKSTPDRQRAMSDSSATNKPGSVHSQLKKFEVKASVQSRHEMGPGHNMSSITGAQRHVGKWNIQSDSTAGNGLALPERNFEQLKVRIKFDAATSRQDSKSLEPLVSPPLKPPRTFAHDEYLQTKLQNSLHQNGTKENQSESHSSVSIATRVSMLNNGADMKEEVMLRTGPTQEGYSHLVQTQKSWHGTQPRDLSPSHPTHAHLRPISEGSALRPHAMHNTNSGTSSDGDGPVVVSLKYGKKLEPPAKVSGIRRNPFDKLPETPKQRPETEGLQLQKSHSSECLDTNVKEDCPTRSASCVARGRGNHVYETLVDSEGFAMPGRFVPASDRAQQEKAGDQPGSLQSKQRLGTSPSEGTFVPVLASIPTPVTDQDLESVPGSKMNIVRQKINQAYQVLHTVFNDQQPGSVSEDAVDQAAHTEGDSDSTVDMKEIRRRVNYCSSVRLKTSHSIKKSREFLEKIYPQLFEYALIVGLRSSPEDQAYDSYVIHKFPPAVNSDMSVPKFCFPDAAEFRPGSAATVSESYSFVLTNIAGGRLFGYCRRIQPPDCSLPEVLCIVSPVDAFNMYNKLLSEIESRRTKSLDHAQELIQASFGRPLPSPGKVCTIRSLDEKGQLETLFLERPEDQRLTNVNYESLLQYLGTDKLIKVFASMLMERRLILCSQQLSTLTQTIHALVALLYPFRWQHVYIPLLPPDMLEVCAAPTPFIIGIMQSHLHRVTALELEDVILVDLDKKQLLRCVGDEATLLPRKVQKALKTALNMCKLDSDALNSQWLMVSEAFLRMFIEMLGHFPHCISTQQDGSKTLMKEHFISGVSSKGIRQFLEWFTETQMFEVFISTQLERETWGSMDLFMTRLGEQQRRRQSDSSQSKGLGRKVKDLGKAIKTKWK